MTILFPVDLRVPVFFDLLAWPGAQPCVARRAKRLGRSAGPGQRRARRAAGQLESSLRHLRAGRFMPRMVCWRRPLPFLYRSRHTWARLARRRMARLRLHWRGDFPPAQRAPTVLDGHTAVPALADPHFAPRRRIVPALRFQLEKAIVVPHHPIVTDRPFTLQSKYPVEFCGARRATVIVLRPRRCTRETLVVFRQILSLQDRRAWVILKRNFSRENKKGAISNLVRKGTFLFWFDNMRRHA